MVRGSAGQVDAFFEGAYRRLGERYIDAVIGALLAGVAFVIIPAYLALLVPIYDLSIGEYLRFVGIFQLFLVPTGGTALFLAPRLWTRPLLDWIGGVRDSASAADAWTAAVAETPRWVPFTTTVFYLATIPGVILIGRDLGFPALGFPAFALVLLAMVAVAGILFYLLLDLALRPVIREIAAVLPRGFVPPRAALPLGRRLSASVAVVSFITAMIVLAAGYNSLGPETYMIVMTATASVSAVVFALLSTIVVRDAVVGRIEELGTAMRAIDDGQLDTYVPPLAGDEIDGLAGSLNRMIEGLREREELRDDLKESRVRLVVAADAERRRMERDLHDGAQQRLVLSGLMLRRVERAVADPPTAAALEEIRSEIDGAQADLRALAHGIYPPALETAGLPAALAQAADRSGVPTPVECEGVGRYPPELEAAVYFCCLEALQNIGKHGGEGVTAKITLGVGDDGGLLFAIADTGSGFRVAEAIESHGLQNMRDRIGALGGTLEIESAPGAGTTVRGTVPA